MTDKPTNDIRRIDSAGREGFIGNDAFEAIDNNYWLPRSCWEPVEESNKSEVRE